MRTGLALLCFFFFAVCCADINLNFNGLLSGAVVPSPSDDQAQELKQLQARSARVKVQQAVLQELYDNVVWPKGANIVYDALWSQNFTISERFFSEDVFIKLPPIGEFEGRLANLEYFYGLAGPVKGGLPSPHRVVNTTFLFMNCWENLCSFRIQISLLDFETNSIKTNFTHHGTVAFNSDNRICGGEIIFVHQAADDIDPTNATELFMHRSSICYVLQDQCTGENAQFASVEECMGFMSSIPYGGFYHFDRNTTSCRLLHLQLQKISPFSASRHCVHSGPSGGGKCIHKPGSFYYTEKEVGFLKCKDPNW